MLLLGYPQFLYLAAHVIKQIFFANSGKEKPHLGEWKVLLGLPATLKVSKYERDIRMKESIYFSTNISIHPYIF